MILLGSHNSELYNETHVTVETSSIVCCKSHTCDEYSEAVCTVCNADLILLNTSSLPKYSRPQPVMPSQQLEFDIDFPFYKDIIPRAPHLQDANIKLDLDATYYNGAPRSQSHRTKPRVHTTCFLGCNIL